MRERPPRRAPRRGEIWLASLDPTEGREQGRTRPVLIISADAFQQVQRDLVMVIPMTTKSKRYAFHIDVTQDETGLRRGPSTIMCD